MFITKKALPRRTFLRGMGATVALPLLDAMVPACAVAATATPLSRLGFFYVPNGMFLPNFHPAATGSNLMLWIRPATTPMDWAGVDRRHHPLVGGSGGAIGSPAGSV